MTPARVLLLLGVLSLACHRATPVQQTPPPRRVPPEVFRDTVSVLRVEGEARRPEFRTPSQGDSLRALLRRERALWRAKAPANYQFLLLSSCFCPGQRGWLSIEVRAGQPLRASNTAGKSVPLDEWDTKSIDGLFDHLEQWAGRDGSVSVEFDPQWHFPTKIGTSARPGPDMWSSVEARGLKPI